MWLLPKSGNALFPKPLLTGIGLTFTANHEGLQGADLYMLLNTFQW